MVDALKAGAWSRLESGPRGKSLGVSTEEVLPARGLLL